MTDLFDELEGQDLFDEININPAAPPAQPAPTNMDEARFRGLKTAINFVTGAERLNEHTQDIPEFSGRTLPNLSDRFKFQSALVTTQNPKRLLKTLKEIQRKNPNLAIQQTDPDTILLTHFDENGKILDRGFLNKPGMTGRDFFQTGAEVAQFLPAARFAGAGKTILGRMGLGATGAGATSVARDIAAGKTAGEHAGEALKNASLKDASLFAAFGGVAEGVMPLLQRFFSRGGNLVRDGQLTQEGHRIANELGLNPEDITPAMIRAFEDNPNILTGQQFGSKEFNIRMTRGQQSGNESLLREEERLRNLSTGAGDRLRNFDKLQQEDVTQALSKAQGLGSERAILTENQGGGLVAQGVQERGAALSSQVDDAFEAVRGKELFFKPDFVNTLSGRMQARLTEEVVDSKLTPAATKALENIDDLISKTSGPVSFKALEIERRKLSQIIGAAKNRTDSRVATIIKNEYDKWIDEAVDVAILSGDRTAISSLKEARALSRKYFQQFTAKNKKDAGGKVIEKMMQLDPTPEQAVNYIFGLGKLGGVQHSVNAIRKLKNVLGESSAEFKAIKEMAFLRLAKPASNTDKFSGRILVKELNEALTGKGETIMKELFSSSEIAMFKRLALTIKKTSPRIFNPSGTAAAAENAARSFLQRFLFLSGDINTHAATRLGGRFFDNVRANGAVSGMLLPKVTGNQALIKSTGVVGAREF